MLRIDHLPAEVLSLIVGHVEPHELFHCALVNKRFYLATIPVLWRAPNVQSEGSTVRLVKSMSHTPTPLGHFVRQLCFDESPSDDTLLMFITHAPFLEELVIRRAMRTSDTCMIHLAQSCQLLKKLHLEHATLLTHRSMHYLGQHCSRLTTLILRTCPNLSPFTLLPLARCPLQFLDLSGCRWLTTDDTAMDLVPFDHLTHLELMCCRNIRASFLQFLSTPQPPSPATMLPSQPHHSPPRHHSHHHHYTNGMAGASGAAASAASASTTAAHTIPLPNLTFFALTGNADMEDYAITAFIATHPRLQELHLLQCDMTDTSLAAIQTSLPHLHALDISYSEHISAIGVRRLIRYSPNLMMIGLHGCRLHVQSFPEAKSTVENYVLSLAYDEIAAIRLTSDDDDNEMALRIQDNPVHDDDNDNDPDEIVENDENDENSDNEPMDHDNPTPNHDNDDMYEVRTLVLNLPDQYSI